MAQIAWDETKPLDSDFYTGAAQQLRSLKTALAVGLATTMRWPGSGGAPNDSSVGSLNAGSARALYDVQSNYSAPSASSAGAAQITSDTSRLFGGASTGSQFLGSASLVEVSAYVGSRVQWTTSRTTASVTDVNGTFGTSDQTTVTVPWANGSFPLVAGYDVIPSAQASLWVLAPGGQHAVQSMTLSLSTITRGGVTYTLSVLSRQTTGPSVSTCTVNVLILSEGTVTI